MCEKQLSSGVGPRSGGVEGFLGGVDGFFRVFVFAEELIDAGAAAFIVGGEG